MKTKIRPGVDGQVYSTSAVEKPEKVGREISWSTMRRARSFILYLFGFVSSGLLSSSSCNLRYFATGILDSSLTAQTLYPYQWQGGY